VSRHAAGPFDGERVLSALGGNAMTAPDGSAAPHAQRAAVEAAMEHVADLVAAGARVALTHGNGPQAGNLLIKNRLAADVVPPVPLDWCGAQPQATVGVLIMNALERALAARGAARPVTAVVARTLVDPGDPAFADPVKPVGRYLPRAEAERFTALGQAWRSYGPRGRRRVVPSPEPLDIPDAGAAAVLLDATTLVIATDVEHVLVGYGTPRERPLHRTPRASCAPSPPPGTSPAAAWGRRWRRRAGSSSGAAAAPRSPRSTGSPTRSAARPEPSWSPKSAPGPAAGLPAAERAARNTTGERGAATCPTRSKSARSPSRA
jgi:carbamate kinase